MGAAASASGTHEVGLAQTPRPAHPWPRSPMYAQKKLKGGFAPPALCACQCVCVCVCVCVCACACACVCVCVCVCTV